MGNCQGPRLLLTSLQEPQSFPYLPRREQILLRVRVKQGHGGLCLVGVVHGGWIFEVEQGAEMGISFLIVLHGIVVIRWELPLEGRGLA